MSDQTPLHAVTAQAGAAFTEGAGFQVPGHFGDPAAEYRHAHTDAVLFDGSHAAKIEITGGDAAMFLHNLSTNDIQGMPVGAGCEAFLCNVKARVFAHVWVYHILLHDGRDAFWLDAAPGFSEKVLKHLDHYLISEQVEFSDRTREFAQVHLAGPHAKTVLGKAVHDTVPDLNENQHMMRTIGSAGTCHIRRRDGLGVPGYDIVCLAARGEAVWRELTAAGAQPAGRAAFEALRIEAGMPLYGVDIDENTLAPEVGRTAQAISYAKGCFLGQEPIVRIRDLGQVNRTLTRLQVEGTEPLPHGAKLFREGKEVGFVTSSAPVPDTDSTVALGYVRRGNADPGTTLDVDIHDTKRIAKVAGSSHVVGATASPVP
jgi:tRNA-modifying protein YgfZ